MKPLGDEQNRDDPQIEIGGQSRTRSEWEKFLKDADTWRLQLAHYQKLAGDRQRDLDDIAAILARRAKSKRASGEG